MKTRPFQIPRLRLAYLAAEEYVRLLWWIVIVPPAFGVVAFFFGSGLMQAAGLAGILWPISIPARGIVSTTKAGRLFTSGCFAELNEQCLTFYDSSTKREKPLRWLIPLIQVRDVVERREFYLVRMRLLGFVPVPLDAFESDEDRAKFVRIIAHAIEERHSR